MPSKRLKQTLWFVTIVVLGLTKCVIHSEKRSETEENKTTTLVLTLLAIVFTLALTFATIGAARSVSTARRRGAGDPTLSHRD